MIAVSTGVNGSRLEFGLQSNETGDSEDHELCM